MPYLGEEGDASLVDLGWTGGVPGLIQFLFRKNILEKPLVMKGLGLKFPPSVDTLFKFPLKYSTGLVAGPTEPLPEEKLSKPFPGLVPLPPDDSGVDWALWFLNFEQELE